MTLEQQEKQLEEAKIALDVAGNYDYCPDPEEAEDIIENLMSYDLEDMRRILKEYSGMSYSNLEDMVEEMEKDYIKALKKAIKSK